MRISDWSSDVCSSDLNRQAGPGVREEVRRGDPREVPRQAAGLQLLAELQLEGEPGRRHDREVPEGDRDLRIQVPDRMSVVKGKSVAVRVEPGGRRILKKKKITDSR